MKIRSRLIPLPQENIDTDQIIPARYLKTTEKVGLGKALMYDWRYDDNGNPKPEFILNRPEAAQSRILLAGDNFGCGSSREHAPWALTGFGFQALISTSFADIFKNNSLKNALLPIVVDKETHAKLFRLAAERPEAEVEIDLASQTLILQDGSKVTFPIDAFAKKCLLEGIDELGYLLGLKDRIAAYESHQGNP
jgi:3-isopropylmalate/(R)-2-methylmalate dehydratase small subunit